MDISHVYKEVEGELKILNAKLMNEASSQHTLVHDIVSHIIQKGKRVRPILLMLIAKSFHANNMEAVINSSFAIELIHTASLLHDDVVDETKKRRGKKTANILWGNKETILVGDYLFSQAFLAISALQNHDATQIIAQSASRLTIGEISQLENERNISVTKQQYFDVIYHKTASLFEASAQLGAIFSQSEIVENGIVANGVVASGIVEKCGEFGKNIGFAFQIMDDILDYTGSKILNKDCGTDFKERKITLPILLLLEEKTEEKALIKQYFSGKSEALTFKQTKALLEKYNIFEKCNAVMKSFTDSAENFVTTNIEDKKLAKILLDLMQFFTKREI